MEWFIENWFVALGLLALVGFGIFLFVKFLGLPTNEQIKKIKAWLLQAIIDTEAELGSKTGKLKLSKVYDLFITKFPTTAKFISFDTFSNYVDLALVEMKKLLETNEAIKQYVEKK